MLTLFRRLADVMFGRPRTGEPPNSAWAGAAMIAGVLVLVGAVMVASGASAGQVAWTMTVLIAMLALAVLALPRAGK